MTTENITPDKKYPLKDIADKGLIPKVTGYQTVYQLVMKETNVTDKTGKTVIKRIPVTETTREKIKAGSNTRPGSKISGKKFILGSELIQFLKLNGYE